VTEKGSVGGVGEKDIHYPFGLYEREAREGVTPVIIGFADPKKGIFFTYPIRKPRK